MSDAEVVAPEGEVVMDRAAEVAQIAAQLDAADKEAPAQAEEGQEQAPEVAADAPAAPQDAPETAGAAEEVPEDSSAPDRSWQALESREKQQIEREKKFREEQKDYTRRLEQLERQLTETRGKTVDVLAQEYQKDPLAALAKHGLDVNALVEAYVNSDDPTPEYIGKKSNSEVEALRQELANVKQEIAKRDAQAGALRFKSDAAKVLSDPKYDKIKKHAVLNGVDPEQMAFMTAVEYHKNNKDAIDPSHRFLTPAAACDRILAVLDERWGKAFDTQEAPAAPQARQPAGEPTTLTNSISSAPTHSGPSSKTRAQEIEEAAAQLRFVEDE